MIALMGTEMFAAPALCELASRLLFPTRADRIHTHLVPYSGTIREADGSHPISQC